MRFTPAALAAALLLATVSSTTLSAPAVAPISPASRAMQAEGERLEAVGSLSDAIGYLETALAADPRNAGAYIALGRIARAQQLPGKAIAYFRAAIALVPTSRAALLGSGQALADRGATDRAREQLTRLQALCGDQSCPEVGQLTAALGAAGERTALRTQDVVPRPVVQPSVPGTP